MTYKQGLLDALEIVNSWAKTAEDMGQIREESILHDVRVMIEEKIADHDGSNDEVTARDVFNESGIKDSSIAKMYLSDYDKDALKIIRHGTGGHQESVEGCKLCSY